MKLFHAPARLSVDGANILCRLAVPLATFPDQVTKHEKVKNLILIYLVSILFDCKLWSLGSKQERFKFGKVARLKCDLGLANLPIIVLESLL